VLNPLSPSRLLIELNPTVAARSEVFANELSAALVAAVAKPRSSTIAFGTSLA
jgi:hypothetical protein